jgi:N-hydroxyarylamine O-acetyltransferase
VNALPVNLSAYFARIGYDGPVEPTLETLNGIVRAHAQAIPFENIDVVLGRPIEIGAAPLQRKLVENCRGGYCFEQNGLLLLVLESIGFAARPLSARVRYGRPSGVTPPRTHLFLRVEIDGTSWLADVGVGGLSVTSAIRLDAAGEQTTPHEPRRIVRDGALWLHQVRLGRDWHDLYEFTLEEMPLIDRELANWYTSAHPQSDFRSRLVVARALPDGGRKTLLNREFTARRRDGTSDGRLIATPEELLMVLADEFGLRLDAGTRLTCAGLDWPP